RVRQATDQFFRLLDLRHGIARVRAQTERHAMAVGVIADPVPLGLSAPCEVLPLAQFLAHYEERRPDVMAAQRREHLRRHIGLGAVVEGQRDDGHASAVMAAPQRANNPAPKTKTRLARSERGAFSENNRAGQYSRPKRFGKTAACGAPKPRGSSNAR